MFRVNEADSPGDYSLATWVVPLTLFLALLASCTSVYLIFQEYDLLSAWLGGSQLPQLEELRSLREQIVLQAACAVLVSGILVVSLAVVRWQERRYRSSQQSLRKVKVLAHDILASMNQGVVTTDRQACITSINSAGIRLLHVDFECVGRPLSSIAAPEVPLVELVDALTKREEPVLDRNYAVERAGRVLRLRGDAHVLTDTQGKTIGSVVHLRDVTERALLEERMHRMERFIGLGTLASGLHHEIKNPLTALSIHLQLLEERLVELAPSEPVEELLGVLKSEVIRLNGVLENFRNFANLQRLTMQRTHVLTVLDNALRLVRPQAIQQQVQLTLLHPDQALPLVPLDADKFQQAVLNLVINALEAMPNGGTVTVAAAVREETLQVQVSDTGGGIPTDVQPNLFQPYYSTKHQGTGMGLAISEKLIAQHGGRINYRTGAGGTSFTISVPLEHQDEKR